MQKFETTRRDLVAAAGAAATIAVVPKLPAPPIEASRQAGKTPVALLWEHAEALDGRVRLFAEELAPLSARSSLPGWMYASGEANRLGHERYDALVGILKTRAHSLDDLATMGRVLREPEIAQGPATWARFRFDEAARSFHLAS
jgi:hypothetical protein